MTEERRNRRVVVLSAELTARLRLVAAHENRSMTACVNYHMRLVCEKTYGLRMRCTKEQMDKWVEDNDVNTESLDRFEENHRVGAFKRKDRCGPKRAEVPADEPSV